ncbi:MAG: S-methyl-5'-thioadenosine phosphorylase [Kofleriaceae bacterium]|nr:S-methyl-5'-thioadenosine phosphorylase [Kofleriaceae bacterium]MCL4228124.1 S-methyl-5'-thioadenosine phosphorylase [Myxococcales bacterium]
MSTQAGVIGIVGGTGLYDLDGLTDQQWITVRSPFGQPSDQLLVGRLGDVKVVFLPRHGRGHRIPPHEIDFRANIDALKRAGCGQVISVSAVGSLRAELPPGTMVVVDQFIDRTLRGPRTFFGTGLVAHVAFGHPVCARLSAALVATGQGLGLPVVDGGTYVAMEGPQFSTRAESELHRGLGASVIGMTNLPEAKLAREAELCYATVAMVTDFDCWHPDHDHVQVADVVRVLTANAASARRLLAAALPVAGAHPAPCPHGCDRALDSAVLTAPEARDPALCARLDAVAGRVLGRGR